MEEFVRIGRALADPVCVRIVVCMRRRDGLSAEVLSQALDLTRPQTDRALGKLRQAHFLALTKSGRHFLYSLSDEIRPLLSECFKLYGEEVMWDPAITRALHQL